MNGQGNTNYGNAGGFTYNPDGTYAYSSHKSEPNLGWSWGAFAFGWLWGIGNHAYLTLIALIPVPLLGLIWMFVNGALGKKWAWESGKFATAEEFNAAQKTWDRAGIAAFIVQLAVLFLIIALIAIIVPIITLGVMETTSSSYMNGII